MKPTLLYIRKYIQQNYNKNQGQNQDTKKVSSINKETKNIKNIQSQNIFKQKSNYLWNNLNTKQFYFQVPKSFISKKKQQNLLKKNSSSINFNAETSLLQNLKPLFIQSHSLTPKQTTEKTIKSQELDKKQTQNKQFSNSINQLGRRTVIISRDLSKKESFTQKINEQKQQDQNQSEVTFIISPPLNLSQKQQFDSKENKQSRFCTKNDETKRQDQLFQFQCQKPSNFVKLGDKKQQINDDIQQMAFSEKSKEHFKVACKSMKRVGYKTYFDYLDEMRKVSEINKKQIKQTFYYPLACMTPDSDDFQKYKEFVNQQRNHFLQKIQGFEKQIEIHQNFKLEVISINSQNTLKSSMKKSKSKFKKVLQKDNTKNPSMTSQQSKSKRFLLEYQQIVICSCSNKTYFQYKLTNTTNFNSFFKYTTPLLESYNNLNKPNQVEHQKQNNNSYNSRIPNISNIKNRNSAGSNKSNNEKSNVIKSCNDIGLYFCSLINMTLKIRQCFFWIGKPIQYYKKDIVINNIDKFVSSIKGIDLFENQKIWIVDCHGRNSFINKSHLVQTNKKNIDNNSMVSSKKIKSRVSKRISLNSSNPLAFSQTSDTYFGLLANSSQFNQSLFVKKQRNKISTKGNFKLLYNSSENGL